MESEEELLKRLSEELARMEAAKLRNKEAAKHSFKLWNSVVLAKEKLSDKFLKWLTK